MNPIIKKDRVVPTEAAPTARRRAHARVARLLTIEGEVRAIEFQCSCGEVSVIELEYAEAVHVDPRGSAAGGVRNEKEP